MFEAEIVLVLNHALTGVVVDKGEDGQDNGELWDANAGVAEGVDDGPRVTEPGDFGEDEATDESRQGKVVVASLREDVTAAGVADEEGE